MSLKWHFAENSPSVFTRKLDVSIFVVMTHYADYKGSDTHNGLESEMESVRTLFILINFFEKKKFQLLKFTYDYRKCLSKTNTHSKEI